MQSPGEARRRKGVGRVVGTKKGFRDEEPRRIWEDEKECSAGEGCNG